MKQSRREETLLHLISAFKQERFHDECRTLSWQHEIELIPPAKSLKMSTWDTSNPNAVRLENVFAVGGMGVPHTPN